MIVPNSWLAIDLSDGSFMIHPLLDRGDIKTIRVCICCVLCEGWKFSRSYVQFLRFHFSPLFCEGVVCAWITLCSVAALALSPIVNAEIGEWPNRG